MKIVALLTVFAGFGWLGSAWMRWRLRQFDLAELHIGLGLVYILVGLAFLAVV